MDVVTFGESMVLLLAEPGVPLAEATSYRRTVAGSESNVTIALARLGHSVGWFGRVGRDPFGDVVLRALRGEGVDVRRASYDDTAPTGVLIRDCHSERPTEVLYYRRDSAGSRLSTVDVDDEYVGAARILHVTGITPVLSEQAHQATLAAVRAAKAQGVTVTFDPNVRRRLAPPERIAELLRPIARDADVVLAGTDEATLLAGQDDADEAARWLLDQGAGLVVLKAGADGSRATDGSRWWQQDAVRVRTLDPVGAGDAYAAGFLAARLDGLDVPAQLRKAAIMGAMAVQAAGDVEGLPFRTIPEDDTVDVRR